MNEPTIILRMNVFVSENGSWAWSAQVGNLTVMMHDGYSTRAAARYAAQMQRFNPCVKIKWG